MAKRIVSDAKLDYPAACNAMVREFLTFHREFTNTVGDSKTHLTDHFIFYFSRLFQETLLVHKDLEQNAVLNELIFALQSNGKS